MARQLGVVCIASWLLVGCATAAPSTGARDVRFGGSQKHEGPVVSEAELQQDLQRFTGQFIDLTTSAASASFDPDDTAKREVALQRVLLWNSSVLDIATGPLPEVNLLDMIVFVVLTRSSVDMHWIPDVFGERGAPLSRAFAQSERDIWTIAAKVMTPQQQNELRDLIAQWRAEHPDQVSVEAVRFADFSVHAGQVEKDRAKNVRGLFGGVRAATSAADRALLLADRAMFLAHRMPFLIRAQTRLGAQEIMDDAFHRLRDADSLLARAPELQPVVNDLSGLLARSEAAARETRKMLEAIDPLVTYATRPEAGGTGRTGLSQALDSSNQLLDKTLLALDRTAELTSNSPHALQLASEQADRMVRRWIAYLVILGAAWAVFFWGGYYLVKRRLAPPTQAQIAPAEVRAGEMRRGHALRARSVSSVHLHARRRMRGTSPARRAPGSDEA